MPRVARVDTTAALKPLQAPSRLQLRNFRQRSSACFARAETRDEAGAITTEPCLEALPAEARRWEDHQIQGFGSKRLVTRLATSADAYPVADCHVAVFSPKNFLGPVLLVDRILALLVGYQQNLSELQRRRNHDLLLQLEAQERDTKPQSTSTPPRSSPPTECGDRCFVCFVADAQPSWPNHLDHQPSASISQGVDPAQEPYPKVPSWVRLVLWAVNQEQVGECWGISYQQRGMLGTVVYDTLGFHIPGRFQDGFWHRRRNVGYISNLAVAPGARRQGIASKLVARCEAVARQDPKVEAVALHVGHVNGAGQKLYEAQGYTAVDHSSEWKELLGINGHNSDLLLMIKRIRQK